MNVMVVLMTLGISHYLILNSDLCTYIIPFQSHLERIVQRPGCQQSTTPALPPPAPTRFHTLFELGAQQTRRTLSPKHDNKSTLACIALAVSICT